MCHALLVSGVTGVGKTVMAAAIGGVLSSAGQVTAVVDTDALAQFGPAPDGAAGLHDRLKCLNLAAVWANFRALGAQYVVVAGGIDTAEVRASYATALAGCAIQQVRLTAPLETVAARLRGREDGAVLERHLRSLAEQEARLESAGLEDFTVVNDRPCDQVAREIVAAAGWLM